MAEKTEIAWTHSTFNPWIGCSKVHEGCTNCYAEADMDHRRHRVKWGPNGTRSRTSDAYWNEPLKWNRDAEQAGERRRVFCASLADVFEDWQGPIVDSQGQRLALHKVWLAMADLRRDLFALIDDTPHLDWLLLTKRPQNVPNMWPLHSYGICPKCRKRVPFDLPNGMLGGVCCGDRVNGGAQGPPARFRANVWLGTSVSNQATANKQIPDLLKCRDLCPVLFLSMEPLLGPVDLSGWMYTIKVEHNGDGDTQEVPCRSDIRWVIVGGESGHGARPMHLQWVRDLRDQCQSADVPFFFKQLGTHPIDTEYTTTASSTRGQVVGIKLRDKKGGDWSEWDADLRVRQFPEVPTRHEGR